MIKISDNCKLNLEKLIATRMLINANSGGGKSWAIRRLLEQSHGQVQQIVIDLEGEFSTLREKFSYLLVGKGGEIPINIRTAELLAKRLLELNVSTIIDLSELKKAERITFVKRFLDSLIDAPKNLWHPALILIDEAHQFAPEKEKSESANSVIDLMTRGRKRGFAGVLATQRISKLNKDAIAEANNCLVGRASLDIDQKRAGDILGFTSKEDVRSLRDLKAGEFYSFGSAFSHSGVEKIFVGKVETTHPDRTKGIEIIKPIETPEDIKKILKDIVDLPKEAEKELKELNDYKNEIIRLKRELSQRPKEQITKEVFKIDERAIEKSRQQGFKEAENNYLNQIKQNEIQFKKSFFEIEKNYRVLENKFSDIGKIIGAFVPKEKFEIPKLTFEPIKSQPQIKPELTHKSNQVLSKLHIEKQQSVSFVSEEENKLKTGAIRILKFIAMFQELTRDKTKTLSGISSQGTFSTYVQDLKRSGFIEIEGNILKITQEGINFAGDVGQMPTDTESLINLWSKHLKTGAIRMLRICVDLYPEIITRLDLQEQSGITSKGTFSTYFQDLRRNGLVKINGQEIKASEELFE